MVVKMRQTVCVDFDGVMNEYTGFDENDLCEPKPYLEEFLCKLDDNYDVVIYTCRDIYKVQSWLYRYGLENIPVKVTNEKIPAIAYIDDRAIQFNGNFNEVLEKLHHFKPYWQKRKTLYRKEPEKKNVLDEIILLGQTDRKRAVDKIDKLMGELKELRKDIIYESYLCNELDWFKDNEPCFEHCCKNEDD